LQILLAGKQFFMKGKKITTDNSCPTPQGTLLIIGGKENKGEEAPENKEKPGDFIQLQVLERFRELTQKKEPVVEVITTASGTAEESFSDYKKVFSEMGFSHIGQIHHTERRQVLEDDLMERVKNADAFFFTGGDQLKLTTLYGGTHFLKQIKERYIHEPIVVAGTSAGAMALSTPMIYAGSQEVQEIGGAIRITTGLEFLRDVCIDTHFVHRGRFVRMAQVIVSNPACIGIGIEEDTAIMVRNGVEAEVIGTGMVIVIEGFELEGTSAEDFTNDKPITARNLKVHLLSDKQQYLIPEFNPPHK
jgi:cyanophycinase